MKRKNNNNEKRFKKKDIFTMLYAHIPEIEDNNIMHDLIYLKKKQLNVSFISIHCKYIK